MDNVYINAERGRDGGVAIYEIGTNSEQTLVFAGNVKDATEYFGGRMSKLAAPPESNKTPFDTMPKPRVATNRHLDSNPNIIPVSSRTLADRIAGHDVEQYAEASSQ